MSVAVFIGDELTACGFRLAGVDVSTPADGAVAEVFREAIRSKALVMISAGCAETVPQSLLGEAERSPAYVVVVPDALGKLPPDLAAKARRRLGLE